MRMGSFGFYKPIFDLYGSVFGSQSVAFRINGSYENARSFRDEVKSERIYVNPSLLFKLGAKTELLLEGDYLKDNRTADFGTHRQQRHVQTHARRRVYAARCLSRVRSRSGVGAG